MSHLLGEIYNEPVMQYGDSTDLESIFETVNAYRPLVLDPVVHNKVDVEDGHGWVHLTELRTIRVNRVPRKSCRMRAVCPCLVCFLTPLIVLLLLCLVLIKAPVVAQPDTIKMTANKHPQHTLQDTTSNASLNPQFDLPEVQSPEVHEPLSPLPQPDGSLTESSTGSQHPMITAQLPTASLLPSPSHLAENVSLEKPHQESKSTCSSDADAAVVKDNQRVFVRSLKPLEEIEVAINEITESFISTLKHDEDWLGWLLKRIRKEQKLRAGKRCFTDMCLYRIPCYLSQKFQSEFAFSKVDYADTRLLSARIRKRRSIEMIEGAGDGEEAVQEASVLSPLLTDLLPKKAATDSKLAELVSAEVQVPSNEVTYVQNESVVTEVVTTVMPSAEEEDSSSMPEKNNNGDDGFNEEVDAGSSGDLDSAYSDNSFGSPLVNCTGVYAEYCYNSISCMFVKVLEAAVCYCKPGYTGVRCDLYNLPQTLDTLSQFQDGTVDIDHLNPGDSAKLYSVLEATACRQPVLPRPVWCPAQATKSRLYRSASNESKACTDGADVELINSLKSLNTAGFISDRDPERLRPIHKDGLAFRPDMRKSSDNVKANWLSENYKPLQQQLAPRGYHQI
ncbi:unnamed protein product [Dibothriocephalus latus]|uniref:EGF-like domain-containing protein n=1 Tax=Dibothriocephalus latus TaxID=60516 RepID=A0A3P6UBG7_DIBLA|nr:unnamed protein product [Dibothriocephalus latus]